MKQKFILFLTLMFSGTTFYSQVTCGFDDLLSATYADSPAKANFDTILARVSAQAATIRANNNPNAKIQQNSYVIPVVFHLVGSNASSLTDAQVTAQLTALNTAFSSTLGSPYSSADDAQIKFCLAQKLPNGQVWSNISSYNSNLYYNTTSGITRCATSAANIITANHNMNPTGSNSMQALLNIAYAGFNTSKYLNIWVVESISKLPSPNVNALAGYGTFPNVNTTIDGIVMRLNAFGINTAFSHSLTSQGTILVHEAGHYLGVFHTFYNGCAGTNTTTCYSAGDQCCDTPPSNAPNQNTCAFFTASPPISCTVPDMYENYMDYQYDNAGNCRNTFTNDQVDRMHASIQLYRPNLVTFSNHVFTGLTNPGGCQANAINAGFITDLPSASKQVCVGQSIGFIASGAASTYSWTFSGATPSVAVGTFTPTGIVYSTPGTYSVTLNITDASNNNYNSTMQIFVSNCNTTISGNRANWYFGKLASVSFSTGIAVSQPNSAMTTDEESATVSDASGNLLFYTNGKSVYNNTHTAMTNGNSTLNGSPNSVPNGGTLSSGQGVVIVPKPGNGNRYFIYTTSDCPVTATINTSFGISQYEVDMTTTTGSVTSTTPVNPTQNYATNEPIVAIPHCNGTNYWLCVKPRNNNQNGLLSAGPSTTINQYIACYSVTSNGIANTPVLSLSAPFVPSSTITPGNDGIGHIAVSPNKSLICIGWAELNLIYVYNFDCSSGKTNYIATLSGSLGYGMAFSPDSKVLYAYASTGNKIIQYDLSQLSLCNQSAPYTIFQTGYNGNSFGSLQLGPDNRIYCSNSGATNLNVINFPNSINSTNSSNECGYNYAAIALNSPATSRLDLPNDIIGQTGQTTDDFSFCLANCGQAKFTNLGCGTTFSWNFGDGYSISGTNTVIPTGTVTTGNYEYPVHTYSSTGTYVVTLSIDGRTNVTHTIVISNAPTATIIGPGIACTTASLTPYSYYAPIGYTYNWSAANGTPSVSTQQNLDVTWLTLPAVLSLTITNSSGCKSSTSLTVYSSSNVSVTVSSNNVCPTPPASTLSVIGAASFTWQPGNLNGNPVVVTPTATTVYTITGLTSAGCSITKTVQVNYISAAGPTISVNSATICSGTSTVLTASGADTYIWNTGATTSTLSVSPTVTTIYTVTGTYSTTGCADTKTATITVKSSPTVAVSNATICEGTSTVLTASGAGTYTWSTGSTTATISISPTVTTIYTVTGTAGHGNTCTNTKTVSVTVNPIPTITLNSSLFSICGTNSATMIASGANNYTWTPSGITSATAIITPTTPTIYTVTGNNNCGTGTATVIVSPTSSLCCSTTTNVIGTSLTSSVNTSGTFANTVYDVQGVITFTANTTFNNCTLRMKANTLLKLANNITLTLTDCKLFSCSELWDGILITATSFTNQGFVSVNNTTIEDMYNGIVYDGNNTELSTAFSADFISITGSRLNKNYISVQVKNSAGGDVPMPFSVKSSTLSSYSSSTSPGSTLKTSSTYTYAYNTWLGGATSSINPPFVSFPRSYTGVLLSNVFRRFTIVGDSTTSANTNTFDNMDFGIRGIEASAKVHNNYFKNITGSIKQGGGVEIPPPAFGPDEIGIAVAMTNTNTTRYSLTVGSNTVLPSSGNPYPKGNVFEDCNKAISALSCLNVYIKANAFNATTTSTLSAPVDAYYYYKNQYGIWVSALSGYENLSYNYIQNFANGIYSSQTLASSSPSPCINQNNIAAPSSTGYCKQAIQICQAGGSNVSTGYLKVQTNTITNVYNGIQANGVADGLNIYNNSVTIEDMNKALGTTTTTVRSAILITSSPNAWIKGNTVTMNGTVPTTSTTAANLTGIFVKGPSSSVKVECNLATHLGRDFAFEGSCATSSWKANTMQDSYRGLEMRLSADIGAQGALTYSGTPNLSANTWTTITQETYVLGTTNVNTASKLYLLAGGSPRTQPILNFATTAGQEFQTGSGFAINPVTGTSYTCNAGNAQRLANGSDGKPNATINSNNYKIAGATDSLAEYTNLVTADETTYEVFADEFMYQNKQLVYKLVELDSINPANGSFLDNFYNANQNTAIDKLTDVQLAIANNDVSAANSANNAAPITNQVEQKYQRANELTLKYMNNRYYVFTADERRDLVNMANECLVKGAYVAQSRNLVDIIMNQAITYDDNCDTEANASRKAKTETSTIASKTSFNLYPNPNNGAMQMDYDLGGYSDATMKLYDVTGKLFIAYKLQNTKGTTIINEQNLHNGIYFYHILVGEKTIKTDKIVIIK